MSRNADGTDLTNDDRALIALFALLQNDSPRAQEQLELVDPPTDLQTIAQAADTLARMARDAY